MGTSIGSRMGMCIRTEERWSLRTNSRDVVRSMAWLRWITCTRLSKVVWVWVVRVFWFKRILICHISSLIARWISFWLFLLDFSVRSLIRMLSLYWWLDRLLCGLGSWLIIWVWSCSFFLRSLWLSLVLNPRVTENFSCCWPSGSINWEKYFQKVESFTWKCLLNFCWKSILCSVDLFV